jgi:hypothetical protein
LNVLSFRDTRVGGRRQANQALLELTRMTGGSYSYINSFQTLRQRVNSMAHSVSTLVVRVDQQPVRMFYNLPQKQKRASGQ